MSTFTGIVKILEVLVIAISYVFGVISRVALEQRLDSIHKSVTKAKTGELEERLKGGKEVEDEWNRHV